MVATLRRKAVIGKVQRLDIMMKTCKVRSVLFLQRVDNATPLNSPRIDCAQSTRLIEHGSNDGDKLGHGSEFVNW